MGAVWALARSELRTRWPALLGLTLIVAIASAVLLTAVVGARRTSTAVERFRDQSHSVDAYIQSDSDENADEIIQTVREQPYVSDFTTRYLVNGWPPDGDDTVADFDMYTDPTGGYGVDVDRPRILRGRMFDPDAPDEIVIDEFTAGMIQRDLGDRIELATWTREDLESLFDGTTFPGFNGPRLDLRVVGVSRSPYALQGQTGESELTALVGPRFLEAHPGVAAWPPVVAVDVQDPDQSIARLETDVGGFTGTDRRAGVDTVAETYLATLNHSVSALTTGLWIFALVAGLAAAVTVGQAVSRQVASASLTSTVTRALGLTTGASAIALATPATFACAAGVAIGAAGSIAWSALLPTGLARRAEPDSGIWIDPWALGVGAIAAITLLTGWTALVARRAHKRATSRSASTTRRPSTIASRLAGWGTPTPIVTGVRHAFEGYGGLSVPVRSALVATVVAVAGVVGAGVVAASVDGLRTDATRWGWTWSSEPNDLGDAASPEALSADDRLAGVAVGTSTEVEFGEIRAPAVSVDVFRGSLNPVIAAGRLPSGRSEVAMAQATMDDLDVDMGDTVIAFDPDGAEPVELTVVGQAVMSLATGPGDGVILTTDGLIQLSRDEDRSENLLLTYPNGADPVVLEQTLRDEYDLSFPPFSRPRPPAAVRNVDQGRGVAIALAIFFTVLGVAGLVHALSVSTRARRPDFAVLRAIGFRGRQVRESVFAQASAIALVGLVVGIPAGLVVGRAFWDGLVRDMGVLDWPTTPWLLIAVAVPAALVISAAIAWLPARSAAHTPTRVILRDDA